MKTDLLPIGTRIRFLKTLTGDANECSPSRVYAYEGELGTITDYNAKEGYWVTSDNWCIAFGAGQKEFDVILPEKSVGDRHWEVRLTDNGARWAITDERGIDMGYFLKKDHLERIAEAYNQIARYAQVCLEQAKAAVVSEQISRVENNNLRSKIAANEAAWKEDIYKSGMGVMIASNGRFIMVRPEIQEQENEKTLEVIHENIDLGIKVNRLLRGEFTPEELQGLCHNLSEDNQKAFCAGCNEYQKKLFGASENEILRQEIASLKAKLTRWESNSHPG